MRTSKQVDQDGPPAVSPDDAGGCGAAWICEHRRDARRAMLGFRRATQGAHLTDWQVIDRQVLSFGRGDHGHILINTKDEAIDVAITTRLVAGRHKNLLGSDTVDVGDDGSIRLTMKPLSAVALLAGSE